jgi:hypothetical protein
MQVVVVVVVSLSHIAAPLQLPLQHLSLFGVVMSVLSPDIQEHIPLHLTNLVACLWQTWSNINIINILLLILPTAHLRCHKSQTGQILLSVLVNVVVHFQ